MALKCVWAASAAGPAIALPIDASENGLIRKMFFKVDLMGLVTCLVHFGVVPRSTIPMRYQLDIRIVAPSYSMPMQLFFHHAVWPD